VSLRRLPPHVLDRLLALVLLAALLVELAVSDRMFVGVWPFELVYGSILALSLAAWNRLPWLTLGFAAVEVLYVGRPPTDGPISSLVALVLIAFLAGWRPAGMPRVGVTGVVLMIVFAVVEEVAPDIQPSDIALPWLLFGGPWLAGVALRLRAEREAAESQVRADTIAAIVADERARIARDLHDSVAHALAVIVLQARGARRQMDSDPTAAREAIESAEMTASTALADVRTVVGALRAEDAAPDRAPAPGLRDLDDLVERVSAAGLPVTVAVEGQRVELSPSVDLSAFRIVQEALTNALTHAGPATAEVALRYRANGLEVVVKDTGRGPAANTADGHGLVGMRERAGLHGGSLEAGAQTEGGFVVRAWLPLETAAP
jgi:signal transduction histidine kinase